MKLSGAFFRVQFANFLKRMGQWDIVEQQKKKNHPERLKFLKNTQSAIMIYVCVCVHTYSNSKATLKI